MSLMPIIPPTAATPAAVSHVDNAGDGVDRTTYTFSGLTLGTGKIVVVVGGANNAVTLSSVTVDGNSASLVVAAANANQRTEIWQYNGNTSATGDVVVTWSGTQGRCAVGVFLVTDAADAAHQTGTSSANPGTFDLDIPASGVAIATDLSANAETHTWTGTGISEDFEQVAEATENILSGASGAFAMEQTNLTITDTPSGASGNVFACASWGPA